MLTHTFFLNTYFHLTFRKKLSILWCIFSVLPNAPQSWLHSISQTFPDGEICGLGLCNACLYWSPISQRDNAGAQLENMEMMLPYNRKSQNKDIHCRITR